MRTDVGRLRIVCRGLGTDNARALAIRRRLEAVARGELPAALERTGLAPDDTDLDRVTVRLELDPDDYDDVTLATLWATWIRDAVEAAVGSAGAAPGNTTAQVEAADVHLANDPSADSDDLATTVRALVRAGLAGRGEGLVRLAQLVVGDPEKVVRFVLEAAGPGRLAQLADGMRTWARVATGARSIPGAGTSAHPPAVRSAIADDGRPIVDAAQADPARVLRAAATDLLAAAGVASAGRDTTPRTQAGDRRPVDTSHGGIAPRRRPIDTRVSGLGLLWPWLRAYLDHGAAGLEGRAAIRARRIALAALAAATPDEASAWDLDPLVRLLAGDDVAGPTPEPAAFDRALGVALRDRADGVLASFAQLLPGFAGSSAAFISREIVLGSGDVELRPDLVRLRIGRRALDPVIDRLPYPLGLIRLPWTPPIELRRGAR
jgi:hypothetical protein